MNTVRSWISSIVVYLVLAGHVVVAEPLATVMKGQIVATTPEKLRVMIAEKDGSILDIAEPNRGGVFKLDLTIMDTPSLSEVMELDLQIRDKSGLRKKVPVAKYLNIFGDTVLLRPIQLK